MELETLLAFFDKSRAIVVDSNIGLIGNSDFRESYRREIYNPALEKHHVALGDYFQVIHSNGLMLIEEYVTGANILISNQETIGYIFTLKDYRVDNPIEDFFDMPSTLLPIIYYDNKDIYTNVKELSHKYKFINNLEYDEEHEELIICNRIFKRIQIDKANHIGKFIEKQE